MSRLEIGRGPQAAADPQGQLRHTCWKQNGGEWEVRICWHFCAVSTSNYNEFHSELWLLPHFSFQASCEVLLGRLTLRTEQSRNRRPQCRILATGLLKVDVCFHSAESEQQGSWKLMFAFSHFKYQNYRMEIKEMLMYFSLENKSLEYVRSTY